MFPSKCNVAKDYKIDFQKLHDCIFMTLMNYTPYTTQNAFKTIIAMVHHTLELMSSIACSEQQTKSIKTIKNFVSCGQYIPLYK